MNGASASNTAAQPGSLPRPAAARARAKPAASSTGLRRVLAIDERPRWVELAATTPGKLALFAVFGGLLACSLPLRTTAIVLAGAAGAAFLRAQRDQAVLAATLLVLIFDPVWYTDAAFEAWVAATNPGLGIAVRDAQRGLTVALFAVAALALHWVARKPESSFARHPVVCLLALIACGSAACLALGGGLATVWLALSIKIVAAYMWFVCYAVVDQRSASRSSLTFSVGLFRPFWGSSSTPIGKGSQYLAKFRCEDPTELAVTQLKALKLLAWSLVLDGLAALLLMGASRAGVPAVDQAVRAHTNGAPFGLAAGWAALIVAVAVGTIELAVWGHRVVACARLAGWKLRRNTWRPLESRSLADFWNRYYFYFKELLVDFFFYPTFFRVFKRHPRLRTFVATFMAAGVGNALYHFVRDIDRMWSLGPGLAVSGFGSYVFYCVALASGIAISQVRTGHGPPRRAGGLHDRIGSFVSVWGFIVLLHVFGGIEDRTVTFEARGSFLLHQFGVWP